MGDHRRWRHALVVAIVVPLLSACPSPETSPPPSTSVTFDVVDSLGSPVAGQAAYQVAGGPGAPLQATEPGVYRFPVPNTDGRYGFSVNCPSGLLASSVSVTSATSLDLVFEFHEGLTPLTTPSFSASVPAGYDPHVDVAFSSSPSSCVRLYSDETSASALAPLGVSDLRPGDLYLIRSSATQGAAPQTTVGTMQFQPSLDEVDLMLPEPWTAAPTVSVSALPTFLGLRRLPEGADTRAHVLVVSWDGILAGPIGIVSPDAMWQFVVSEGWLAGEEAYSAPDLTDLPGFLGARPLTGETVSWTIGTLASNLDTRALLTGPAHPLGLESGIYSPLFPPRVAGAVNRVAFVQGAYVAP